MTSPPYNTTCTASFNLMRFYDRTHHLTSVLRCFCSSARWKRWRTCPPTPSLTSWASLRVWTPSPPSQRRAQVFLTSLLMTLDCCPPLHVAADTTCFHITLDSTVQKNGEDTQKRSLTIKDDTGRSVELSFWGHMASKPGDELEQVSIRSIYAGSVSEGVWMSDCRGACRWWARGRTPSWRSSLHGLAISTASRCLPSAPRRSLSTLTFPTPAACGTGEGYAIICEICCRA